MINNTFSSHLQQLRKAAKLTNNELAKLADVPESLISGLQNNNRRVGEYQARKIGTALKIHDEELEHFVLAAIDTCSEKVLNALKDYPAQLLNLLASQLREANIFPQAINDIAVNEGDITLTLNDGRIAMLTTRLLCD